MSLTGERSLSEAVRQQLLKALVSLLRLDAAYWSCETWGELYTSVSLRYLPHRLTILGVALFADRYPGELDHLLTTVRQINRDHDGAPCEIVLMD